LASSFIELDTTVARPDVGKLVVSRNELDTISTSNDISTEVEHVLDKSHYYVAPSPRAIEWLR
jgi:hypothetical protein